MSITVYTKPACVQCDATKRLLTKLNLDLQQTINQLNLQLTAISAGLSGVGGVYVPTPVTLDISDAKTDKIKV